MHYFKFPDVGEGIHEGRIIKWLVKEDDIVKEDQNIVEIETDKAIVELPSPKSGTVLAILAKEKDTIKVGQILVVIGSTEEKENVKVEVEENEKLEKQAEQGEKMEGKEKEKSGGEIGERKAAESIISLPYVRKLAKELKADITKIKGSGKYDEITEQDVRAYAKFGAVEEKGEKEEKKTVLRETKITFDKYGRVIRIPFTGMRKTISEHVLEAVRKTAQVTYFDDADANAISELREKKKDEAKQQGFPLTFLPFVAKAIELALKENPYFNSSIDEKTNEIVLKQYFNIGFAVDVTDGLLVPVVKNVDQKGVMEIAKEMKHLSDACRNRQIKLEDMRGGTFTITNIGSIGGKYFTPIINYPETAILGMGRIRKQQVFENNSWKTINTLPLSLTFDHRIIDGARAARFMNDLISYLENAEALSDKI